MSPQLISSLNAQLERTRADTSSLTCIRARNFTLCSATYTVMAGTSTDTAAAQQCCLHVRQHSSKRAEAIFMPGLTLIAMPSASIRLPSMLSTSASMHSTQHVRPDRMQSALRSRGLPAARPVEHKLVHLPATCTDALWEHENELHGLVCASEGAIQACSCPASITDHCAAGGSWARYVKGAMAYLCQKDQHSGSSLISVPSQKPGSRLSVPALQRHGCIINLLHVVHTMILCAAQRPHTCNSGPVHGLHSTVIWTPPQSGVSGNGDPNSACIRTLHTSVSFHGEQSSRCMTAHGPEGSPSHRQ